MKNGALVFTITNAVVFQLGWLICILWGNLAAVTFTLLALSLHFFKSSVRLADAIAVVVSIIIGLLHDSILIYGGHIVFAESASFPPLWLICLWALMGTTLNHSLQWIYSRPLWSSLLGAVSGSLSYLAGVALSAAEWSSPQLDIIPIIAAVPLIAFLWLLVLPLHRLFSLRILSYVCSNKTTVTS